MTSAQSDYHLLYLEIKDADDYFPLEDREEALELIKSLYKSNLELKKDLDAGGKYGISYKTIHDDSRYPDKFNKFFETKELRDNVFSDWENKRYWDNIFETTLPYELPSPNLHDLKKVFKEGGNIYEEKSSSYELELNKVISTVESKLSESDYIDVAENIRDEMKSLSRYIRNGDILGYPLSDLVLALDSSTVIDVDGKVKECLELVKDFLERSH